MDLRGRSLLKVTDGPVDRDGQVRAATGREPPASSQAMSTTMTATVQFAPAWIPATRPSGTSCLTGPRLQPATSRLGRRKPAKSRLSPSRRSFALPGAHLCLRQVGSALPDGFAPWHFRDHGR